MDTSFEMIYYFKQDLVNEDVTSFSAGNVWLYFFRETLIGYRDMADESQTRFLDASKPLENDNYTSRHLITPAIVKSAYAEAESPNPPQLISMEELVNHAMRGVVASVDHMIHKNLFG